MARIIPNPKGGGGTETLPPPGDERREVLDAREEQLAEAAETATPEVETINPKALRLENELVSQFNALEVSGALPEMRYAWAYTGTNGMVIKWMLAQGWEVVQGDMPEAIEQKGLGGDTTRRIGDTILMRMRLDRFVLLQRRRAALLRAREEGLTAGLHELASKHPAIKVREFSDPSELSENAQARVATRQLSRGLATKKFDQMLRRGRVPGMPAPGTRGR